jgi:Lon protease-like protein
MDDNLAKDFVALWQSELTAAAADRELREMFTALVGLWAGAANNALTQLARHDAASGSAKTAQPAGAAPAPPASDASLAQIEQLSRRVAELEQILAKLLDQRGSNAA